LAFARTLLSAALAGAIALRSVACIGRAGYSPARPTSIFRTDMGVIHIPHAWQAS
jgi:hypothetical protein